MAKRTRSKSGSKPAATAKTTEGKPKRTAPSGDVTLALLAAVVAVWAGAPWLTPLLLTAPLAFYLARGSASDEDARYFLFRRWAITVLVTMMAATVFAPASALRAVPWGSEALTRIEAWMEGNAGAPLGTMYMLLAAVATLAGTVLSAGVVGVLVYSSVIALNAVYATILLSKGYNVILMAFVAVSPWQWCFLLGLFVLITPLSVFSRSRILSRDGSAFDWNEKRRTIMIGAALLVAAFLLRWVAAGPYTTLVRNWTVY
jgi:hypothetical protein